MLRGLSFFAKRVFSCKNLYTILSEKFVHTYFVKKLTKSEINISEFSCRYLDNRELEEMERRQRDSASPVKSQQQYVKLTSSASSEAGGSDKVSFADLRKQKARDQFHSSGINITYTEHEKEDVPKKSSTSSLLQQRRDSQQKAEETTTPQSSPGPGNCKQLFVYIFSKN